MSSLNDEENERLVPEKDKFPKPVFRDISFSIAFVIHLVLVFALFGVGIYFPEKQYDAATHGDNLFLILGSLPAPTLYKLLLLVSLVGVCAACWSFFMIALLRISPVAMIWAGLLFGLAAGLATAIWSAVSGGPIWVTVLLFVFCLFDVLFIIFVRRRIAFSAILLATVSHVSKSYPALIVCSILTFVLMMIWLAIWSTTVTVSQRILPIQGKSE